jgi:hypothetical protein
MVMSYLGVIIIKYRLRELSSSLVLQGFLKSFTEDFLNLPFSEAMTSSLLTTVVSADLRLQH